jgi:hypothetical protein
MATDVREHTAPAGGEQPHRRAINDLSLSIKDPIPVANTTARAQKLVDLAGEGITPSAANPVFFFRADAGAGRQLEFTINGTDFYGSTDTGWTQSPLTLGSGVIHHSTAPWTGLNVRRIQAFGAPSVVYVTGANQKTTWAVGDTIATLATGWRPTTMIQGVNCQVTPAGAILSTIASATPAQSFSASFPV